jgi:hypothetical protein
MGDKVAARIAATNAGLPIIPGTETAINTAEVRFDGPKFKSDLNFFVPLYRNYLNANESNDIIF